MVLRHFVVAHAMRPCCTPNFIISRPFYSSDRRWWLGGRNQTTCTCCWYSVFFEKKKNSFLPCLCERDLLSSCAESSLQLCVFPFMHFDRSMDLKTLFLICFAILSACMSTNYSWCAIVRIKGSRVVIFAFMLSVRLMNGQTHVKCEHKSCPNSNEKAGNTFIHCIGSDSDTGQVCVGPCQSIMRYECAIPWWCFASSMSLK